MTAQNITFKDYAVGSTPVLIVNGIGKFSIQPMGQSPTSVTQTLQAPFTTLADQIAHVGTFGFVSGLYYGIDADISRTPIPATRTYKPAHDGDPGYDTAFDGAHQPTFTINGVDGNSSPGPLTFPNPPVPLEFTAPSKIWALNVNTESVVTVRVWNWI